MTFILNMLWILRDNKRLSSLVWIRSKPLLERINELEAEQTWDKQIAADAAHGKLDFLMAEALEAEQKGQLSVG